ELGIPVEEVAPTLVQIVGWEGAAIVAQHLRARLHRHVAREHARFFGQAAALHQIAARTGGDDVLPRRPAAARAWHQMVEGQVMRREIVAAILAGETIAQEDVEPGEGRAPCHRDIGFERDDARQPHLETGAADDLIVMRDDMDAIETNSLDYFLPWPNG